MANIDDTLAERGANYGDFNTQAAIAQGIKDIMRNSAAWSKMTSAQKESLDMIANKIGRICNGDPNYKDSWTDVGGYTRLVEKTLDEPVHPDKVASK